jgi:hypothetical protein
MTGAQAIALARRRGVTLEVFLGKLRVYSEGEPDEILVRLLRDNKQAVVDTLLEAEAESDRWKWRRAETIETIMHLRGLTRPDAEHEAFTHVLIEYLNETHPDTNPTRCAHYGGPETQDATLLPIGWGDRHAWLHHRCWAPWSECRRRRLSQPWRQSGSRSPLPRPVVRDFRRQTQAYRGWLTSCRIDRETTGVDSFETQ